MRTIGAFKRRRPVQDLVPAKSKQPALVTQKASLRKPVPKSSQPKDIASKPISEMLTRRKSHVESDDEIEELSPSSFSQRLQSFR